MNKQSQFLTAAVCTVLYFFCGPISALAYDEKGLECLRQSEKRSIRWDESWQGDQGDHDVSYKIVGVTPARGVAHASLNLELVALATAQRSVRYLYVDSETFARRVCLRIFGAKPLAATPQNTPVVAKPAVPAPTRTPMKPLRFITFKGKSWVLADAPPKETLSICTVLKENFLCREAEKQQHSDKLHDLEQELLIEQSARPGK